MIDDSFQSIKALITILQSLDHILLTFSKCKKFISCFFIDIELLDELKIIFTLNVSVHSYKTPSFQVFHIPNKRQETQKVFLTH